MQWSRLGGMHPYAMEPPGRDAGWGVHIPLYPADRAARRCVLHRCGLLLCCTWVRVCLAVGKSRVNPAGLCPSPQVAPLHGVHLHKASSIAWGCIPCLSLSGAALSLISHASPGSSCLPYRPSLLSQPWDTPSARDPSLPRRCRVGGNSWPEAALCQLWLSGSWGSSKESQANFALICTGHLQPTPYLTPPSPAAMLQGTQGTMRPSPTEAWSRGHSSPLPVQDTGLSLPCPAHPALSSPLLGAAPGAGGSSSPTPPRTQG